MLFSAFSQTRQYVEKHLKSMSGTIRGKKNAVRAAMDTFFQSAKFESELLEQLYAEEKENSIASFFARNRAGHEAHSLCRCYI